MDADKLLISFRIVNIMFYRVYFLVAQILIISHNLVPTAKSLSITDKDRDFITSMIFKKRLLVLLYVLVSGYCYCLTLYVLFLLSYSSCVLILQCLVAVRQHELKS